MPDSHRVLNESHIISTFKNCIFIFHLSNKFFKFQSYINYTSKNVNLFKKSTYLKKNQTQTTDVNQDKGNYYEWVEVI